MPSQTRSTTCGWTVLTLLAVSLNGLDASADWRQFRGNQTNGRATGSRIDWSGEHDLAWQQPLPGRGLSSPIIIADRVFVTCSSGPMQDRLHVLSFSTESEEKLWERTFWATGRTVTHPKTCVAAPSPASDGERIFAFYSSNDLACLDLDGNLLWYRGLNVDFPNASNSLGMASSLVVVDDVVVAMVESDDQSFTAGIDVQTGQTRWQIDRPRAANWTSPAIWQSDETTQVLLQSSRGVSAVDPQSGNVLWNYGDGASTTPSLVVADGTAYVPSHGITAIRPGETTRDVADILWQVGNLSPGTASPIVYAGKLYVVNRAGVLSRASLEDGEREWQSRLKGPFSASPVEAGGKLVFVNEEGLVQVADPEDQGNVVATRELEETILGTPAVSETAIYIRSDGHLWKLNMN